MKLVTLNFILSVSIFVSASASPFNNFIQLNDIQIESNDDQIESNNNLESFAEFNENENEEINSNEEEDIDKFSLDNIINLAESNEAEEKFEENDPNLIENFAELYEAENLDEELQNNDENYGDNPPVYNKEYNKDPSPSYNKDKGYEASSNDKYEKNQGNVYGNGNKKTEEYNKRSGYVNDYKKTGEYGEHGYNALKEYKKMNDIDYSKKYGGKGKYGSRGIGSKGNIYIYLLKLENIYVFI